jgi:hypothetical protein
VFTCLEIAREQFRRFSQKTDESGKQELSDPEAAIGRRCACPTTQNKKNRQAWACRFSHSLLN